MKEDRVFVDTNIIVYAYDVSSGEKHGKALEIMKALWNNGNGMTSTQVLQELFVTVTKKLVRPLDVITAKEIVRDLLTWNPSSSTGR
jgi:predicted nucleic acid-binding protein